MFDSRVLISSTCPTINNLRDKRSFHLKGLIKAMTNTLATINQYQCCKYGSKTVADYSLSEQYVWIRIYF